jgi:hypothetical protein
VEGKFRELRLYRILGSSCSLGPFFNAAGRWSGLEQDMKEGFVKLKRMATLTKWARLLALLPNRPREFYGRVTVQGEIILEHLLAERLLGKPPQYEAMDWVTFLRDISLHYDHVAEIVDEPALRTIEKSVRQQYEDIHYDLLGVPEWAADLIFARCCYVMCRLLKPNAVVEGGVSYGVSSAFILKALKENYRGMLHSVDLPTLRHRSDDLWGIAVPDELRSRWKLHRGYSRHLLPNVLRDIGKVDVFVDDALSTYRAMKWDFKTVWPHLQTGGMLIANQVHLNRAFSELHQRKPAYWRVIRDTTQEPLFGEGEQNVMFGIAVK